MTVDITKMCNLQNDAICIMGILNSSPESFYKESIYTTRQSIQNRAKIIENQGASLIDIGGMSTAPYLNTMISETVESKRIIMAIKAIKNVCNLPISVDTCRAKVAQDAIKEGASIINDITGFKHDDNMSRIAQRYEVSVILGAYGGASNDDETLQQISANDKKHHNVRFTKKLLEQSIKIATDAKIPASKIAIDPSIGFFRNDDDAIGNFYTKISSPDWTSRDIDVISDLSLLSSTSTQHTPIVISVSNKSFLGNITNHTKAFERTYASVAAETIAILHGANIIRTHNVAAAHDAALIALRFMTKHPRCS